MKLRGFIAKLWNIKILKVGLGWHLLSFTYFFGVDASFPSTVFLTPNLLDISKLTGPALVSVYFYIRFFEPFKDYPKRERVFDRGALLLGGLAAGSALTLVALSFSRFYDWTFILDENISWNNVSVKSGVAVGDFVLVFLGAYVFSFFLFGFLKFVMIAIGFLAGKADVNKTPAKVVYQTFLFVSFACLAADLLILVYVPPTFQEVFACYGAKPPTFLSMICALSNFIRPLKIPALLLLSSLWAYWAFRSKMQKGRLTGFLIVLFFHLLVFSALILWGHYIPVFEVGNAVQKGRPYLSSVALPEAFQEMVEKNPKDAHAYANWGDSLEYYGKRYDEAVKKFQKAVELDQSNTFYRWCEGMALLRWGKEKEAAIELQKAIDIEKDPKLLSFYYLDWAEELAGMGKEDEAEERFQLFVQKFPRAEAGYNHWGWRMMDQHRYTEAAEDFEKAILISPREDSNYEMRAEALSRAGRHEEAILQYQEMLGRFHHLNEPERAYFALGVELRSVGRYEDALIDLKKVLKLDCDNKLYAATKNEIVEIENELKAKGQ